MTLSIPWKTDGDGLDGAMTLRGSWLGVGSDVLTAGETTSPPSIGRVTLF